MKTCRAHCTRVALRCWKSLLRTAAGLAAIERASQLAEDIVVGVGTITKPEHCAQAKKAGAQFGVSPGLTKDMHKAAQDAGLPLLPGVMTPTDIITALELGYEIVKFFPAQQAGGIPMLQAYYGPFPTLKFCPTGGITAETSDASTSSHNRTSCASAVRGSRRKPRLRRKTGTKSRALREPPANWSRLLTKPHRSTIR